MPQPFPKSLGAPQIQVGLAIQSRPQLALVGMHIISDWSKLESMLSTVFITLLGANPGPAAAVFTSLRNNNVQREAILAVAAETLEDQDKLLLEAVLNRYLSAAKPRDKIAHHMWAVDKRIPNDVILVEPKHYVKHVILARVAKEDPTSAPRYAKEIAKTLTKACSVWKAKDFEDAAEAITRVFRILVLFNIVMSTGGESQSERDKARTELSQMPEIREFLSRSAQSRSNGP